MLQFIITKIVLKIVKIRMRHLIYFHVTFKGFYGENLQQNITEYSLYFYQVCVKKLPKERSNVGIQPICIIL